MFPPQITNPTIMAPNKENMENFKYIQTTNKRHEYAIKEQRD